MQKFRYFFNQWSVWHSIKLSLEEMKRFLGFYGDRCNCRVGLVWEIQQSTLETKNHY